MGILFYRTGSMFLVLQMRDRLSSACHRWQAELENFLLTISACVIARRGRTLECR